MAQDDSMNMILKYSALTCGIIDIALEDKAFGEESKEFYASFIIKYITEKSEVEAHRERVQRASRTERG